MIRPTPSSTLPDTPFPYTPPFRSLPGPRRERRGQPERGCTAGAPPHRPRPGPPLHRTALAAYFSTSAALQEPPMSRAPSLFISHGSPMFSIEPGELGPNLRQLGRTLADLSAIVVVSPHWQTQGVRVGATAMPETIHDFSGFPAPLYELQYTPPGAPALAAQIVRMLVDAGFLATIDARRGLDHGAWVPLRYLRSEEHTSELQSLMRISYAV